MIFWIMGARIIGAFLQGFTSKFWGDQRIFFDLDDFSNYRSSNYMSSTVFIKFHTRVSRNFLRGKVKQELRVQIHELED